MFHAKPYEIRPQKGGSQKPPKQGIKTDEKCNCRYTRYGARSQGVIELVHAVSIREKGNVRNCGDVRKHVDLNQSLADFQFTLKTLAWRLRGR